MALVWPSLCGKSLAKQMPKTSMNMDRAATISLRVLAFLAEDGSRLQRFLNLTGIAPEALAALAPKAHFHAALLEYLLANEPLLIEFCDREDVDPSHPARALHVLTGGRKEPQ
jgi:hypothetical protein